MKSIEQVVADATRVYMPKGKEVAVCTELLEGMGVGPPALDDDIPRGVDTVGRMYIRGRAKDGVRKLRQGFAPEGSIVFTGTDVCEEYIDADPDTNLGYAVFGEDGEPTCTYELLLPKDNVEPLVDRLLGDGKPLTIVTSSPLTLGRVARERGWNMRPSEFVPDGGVEIQARTMIEDGLADAAADLVTSGRAARAADLLSSKEMPEDYPINPILRSIYGAVVWRKSNTTIPSKQSYGIDRTLAERSAQVGDPEMTSYTLELLRNPNEALKKFGSESAEFLDAVLRRDSTDSEEFADMVYAALVLSRANEGRLTLAGLVDVLQGRNANSVTTKG